jgi:predicted DNA-binding protein (MmcQ/YjbR family)
MTIEVLQAICNELPGVTSDIKWEEHLCFNVGHKMFLITSPDSFPPTASFKVSDEEFEILLSKDGFTPSKHLGRYKWVHLDDINKLSISEWKRLIRQSYQLVFSKLTAKVKKQIDAKNSSANKS